MTETSRHLPADSPIVQQARKLVALQDKIAELKEAEMIQRLEFCNNMLEMKMGDKVTVVVNREHLNKDEPTETYEVKLPTNLKLSIDTDIYDSVLSEESKMAVNVKYDLAKREYNLLPDKHHKELSAFVVSKAAAPVIKQNYKNQ